VIESADMAIDDIDQAGWKVRAMIDALELVKEDVNSKGR
jgi:hypothetical protein